MERNHLALRMTIQISQDSGVVILPMKQNYCRHKMMTSRQRVNDPKLLISTDKTTEYLNCLPKCTLHSKDDHTVSIRLGFVYYWCDRRHENAPFGYP